MRYSAGLEGQNLAIEYRWAEGRREQLPALAAELVRLKVDVILASTGQEVTAAKDATTTIPIVFRGVSDLPALLTGGSPASRGPAGTSRA